MSPTRPPTPPSSQRRPPLHPEADSSSRRRPPCRPQLRPQAKTSRRAPAVPQDGCAVQGWIDLGPGHAVPDTSSPRHPWTALALPAEDDDDDEHHLPPPTPPPTPPPKGPQREDQDVRASRDAWPTRAPWYVADTTQTDAGLRVDAFRRRKRLSSEQLSDGVGFGAFGGSVDSLRHRPPVLESFPSANIGRPTPTRHPTPAGTPSRYIFLASARHHALSSFPSFQDARFPSRCTHDAGKASPVFVLLMIPPISRPTAHEFMRHIFLSSMATVL
ncbi:hypothetical protein B0H15DRAFT_1025220 [Mycena belliarum]|uniref:Uncharacterized protein n=1 Tax=Mycena belliarum TaxID=1033014 RepID=A0AAD6TUR5_9AGAR|nr:hypothetical protein B0H15DRAFT_1025220 [Mycena belliae]